MNTAKRLISLVLVLVMLVGMMPLSARAEETDGTQQAESETNSVLTTNETEETQSATEATESSDDIPVTRAQWLQLLVQTFSMTVENEVYPDNYFVDLDSSSEYYYDMLLAVEFGVVDIPAGGNLYPDAAATREFAAVTMNFCLGFQPDPEITLTFSESGTVAAPYDIQIAIDRGWFALVDGAFLPEQSITQAEADLMVADAAAVLAAAEIDEDFESVYTYTAEVVEVPDGTTVESTDTGLTIYDCPVTLNVGDVFVVYFEGIPCLYLAESVSVSGNQTVLTVSTVDESLYYEELEMQGTVDAKFTDFIPEEGTEVLYVDEETGEEYTDPVAAEQTMALRAQNQAVYAGGTIKLDRTIKVRQSLGKYGISGYVEVELKNPKIVYDVNLGKKSVMVKLVADADINFGVEADLAEALELDEIRLGFIGVNGIGGLTISLTMEAKAALYGSVSGKLTKGVEFKNGSFRLIKSFKKDSFSLVAEFTGKIGIIAKLGITDIPADALEGYVYAEIGAKGEVTHKIYEDDTCTHVAFYMYFEAGFKAAVKLGFYKKSWEETVDIWDDSNSPIRAVHHYDNGVLVPGCTLGHDDDDTNNGYYTPTESPYWGSNWSGGDNSTGYNSSGEPVVTYGYSLDDMKQATITSYTGNATSLTIPETIDGYPIIAIGSNVFKNRTGLKTVIMHDNIQSIGGSAFAGCTGLSNLTLSSGLLTIEGSAFSGCTSLTVLEMPDTVTSIGNFAFYNCTSLRSVYLSKSLTSIGGSAFQNCNALTKIEIPKSLEETYDAYGGDHGWAYGAFYGCENLTNITFEEGTTRIAQGLFANLPSLVSIVIPDTVTSIDHNAFNSCTNLRSVSFSNSLITIGSSAFAGCTSLTSVQLPDTVETIENFAFYNCTALNDLKLSKSLLTMGGSAFQDCDALESVEIPRSLEETYDAYGGDHGWEYGVFYGCDNLKHVTFEDGTARIVQGLFASCYGLESIAIPDTVVSIDYHAFEDCKNLRTVTFSNALTNIANGAFENCLLLDTVELPDTVQTIEQFAFYNCASLTTLKLSNSLLTMGGSAFQDCDALESVEIPRSLEETYDAYGGDHGWEYGVFYGCDNLKNVTFEEGTSRIAQGLFASCYGLESIVIPDTVVSIDYHAFEDCKNLKTVTFSNVLTSIGNGAFEGCLLLEAVELPNTVQTIEQFAFYNCQSLAVLKLSKSLRTIGGSAFQDCDALESVEIPKSLEETYDAYGGDHGWEYGVFYGCDNLINVTFEEGTSRIAQGLFANCPGIVNITIPDSVQNIGYKAFYNCDGLTEIVIPESVTAISTHVFNSCGALTTATWPSSLTEIPEYTFSGCTALATVNLPDNLATISKYAFNNCDALVTFTMPDSITILGENAFYDCDGLIQIHLSENLTKLNKNTFYDSDALTSIVIPGSVTSIGVSCFYDCDALLSVEIQYGPTSIGNACFYDCDLLTTVDMANSITSMGTNVFYHNAQLKNVKLSQNLTSIPTGTFMECLELEEIVIPYFTTTIAANAFNASPKLAKVVTHANLTSIDTTAFSYPAVTKFYGIADSYTQTWCTDNGYTFNENTVTATGLTVAETTVSLAKGTTKMLDIEITPNDFADTITFKSSNTDVVTVAENGLLTAVAPGSATVKIIVGSKSASVKVTVTQAVTKITLNKSTLSLDVPETYQLTATVAPTDASNQVLEWTSSNEAAATVDQNGLVTAVGNGTAVITATATDGTGVSASCTVTVIDPDNIPVSSITLDKTAMNMEALEVYQLTATIAPADAANKTIRWTSSDENVATVDENGLVTAIAKGTATITAAATDESGVSTSCTVTVTNNACIVADPTQMESEHPYPNDFSDFWVYTIPGASGLKITFDEQTAIEDGFDFLLIYNSANEVVTYTGTDLAGQTIEITGSTVKIKLMSDDSGTEWGFKVTSVEPITGSHNYEAVVTNPTCTEQGYTTYTCSECGDSYVDDYVDALGHDYTDVVTAPICDEDGYTTYTCTRCGDSYVDDYVDALGHDYTSVVTAPTCDEDGYTTYTCTRCGDSYVDDYVDALGHDYTSVVTEPTCEERGCTTYTCTRCGDSYEEDYVDALGHDMGEWTADGDGQERRDCSRCDYYETRETETVELDVPSVTIAVVASSGKPKLSWNKVDGAVKYEVYRATSETGTYSRLTTTTGTSLTNSSAAVGQTYYYKVRAVAQNGTKSEFSEIVSRTCTLPRPVITLSNVASSGKVKITWEKIDGAVKYEIYRSTDNKNWTLLSTTTGTNLTNTSTTAGSLYYYKVKAIANNSVANSAYSAVKSRRCDLARPTIKSLTIVASTGKIKIKWGAVTGAVKYELYCSTDNENWTKLITTTGTSITHSSGVAGTRYYYKVRAIASNSSANSADSAVKNGYCDLARPTLTVTLNSKDKPVLTWTKIEGAVKYEVYRSTDNKTWTKLSTTTGTKLTNTSAVSGTKYYYKVRAIASISNSNSAYSTVKSITAG